jgi:hypothetical protein
VERELRMVQLSATRCSCIAILSVSLASFATVTLYVASQRVFIVISLYFVIVSVRKLLDTLSYLQARSSLGRLQQNFLPFDFLTSSLSSFPQSPFGTTARDLRMSQTAGSMCRR